MPKVLGGGGGASLPPQTGNSGEFLTTDGTSAAWAPLAGGGDMAAAVYDPQTIGSDAFDRANHTGTQLAATISDLDESVQDLIGAALVEGTNITLTYDDGAGTITIDAAGDGGGADAITVDGTSVEIIEFDDSDFGVSILGSTATITALGGGGGAGISQPFYETVNPVEITVAASAISANVATLIRMPKLPAGTNFTEITVYVGTAAGNLDVGAYTSDDLSTFTRVGSSGSTAAAGTNALQTFAVAFTIPDDTVWYLAVAGDNASCTLARIATSSPAATKTYNKQVVHKSASFPLPSSLSSMSETVLVGYWISTK